MSKGTVGVESIQGRLRLRLPRQLYPGGKQKYLTLGLDDTPENRKIAHAKAKQIEADIVFERFDFSLVSYKLRYGKAVQVTIGELWNRYVQYKTPTCSPKTVVDCYGPIGKHLSKCPHQSVDAPLAVREYLLKVTTQQMARRVLMHLSAACKWGVKNKLIASNPFDGLYLELGKPQHKPAKPFTIQERDAIIETFKRRYPHYAPFVQFLFLTGCRPSEAIGLRWENVGTDSVTFSEAVVLAGGRKIHRDTTKTKHSRVFPCSAQLTQSLSTTRGCTGLVFPGKNGGPINYTRFSRGVWKAVMDELGLSGTPYNCRDTFITIQVERGVTSDIVARWVGNSPEVIRKHYLGQIETLRPLDV